MCERVKVRECVCVTEFKRVNLRERRSEVTVSKCCWLSLMVGSGGLV